MTNTTTELQCILLGFGNSYLTQFAKFFGKLPNINLQSIRGGHPNTTKELQAEFPTCEVNTYEEEMLFHEEYFANIHPGAILSSEIIRDYTDVESVFMEMSDRFCVIPLSVSDRKRLYYKSLAYSINYFRNTPVDVILCLQTAHMCFDYVFCEVAKRVGVSIQIIERTLFDELILLRDDPKNMEVPNDYLGGESLDSIREAMGNELNEKLDIPNKLYDYTKSTGSGFESTSFLRFLPRFLLNTARSILHPSFWLKSETLTTFSVFNKTLARWGGRTTAFKRLLELKNHFLISHYESLATNFLPNDKFIYFALHLQPERSTCPEGGVYVDQLLAAESLAKALPNGWKLVVKEHPSQFKRNRLNSFHARSKAYYDQLASHENIILVSLCVPSDELTLKAEAVATITGTVGWEAIGIGKPALIFGSPWYSGCPGAFNVSGPESCESALKEALTMDKNQIIEGRYRFLAWNKHKFLRGATLEHLIDPPAKKTELAQKMAESVYNHLQAIIER